MIQFAIKTLKPSRFLLLFIIFTATKTVNLYSTSLLETLPYCNTLDTVSEKIVEQLIVDGYVDNKEDNIYFFVFEDRIQTNDYTLTEGTFQKYLNLLQKLGVKSTKYWGIYHTTDGGFFRGTSNPNIIKRIIAVHNNRITDKECSSKDTLKPNTKLAIMHQIVEDLSQKLKDDDIVPQEVDKILVECQDGRLTINQNILSRSKSEQYFTFLENKGITKIEDGFSLTILGKEHWRIHGKYNTNF